MAGFDVGIINIIADNLRDRYKSGFPVLKEIIQNTDDAASQSNRDVQLDFGFTHGIPEAGHPLLKGPAIFFLNNGSFSEQDARAVKSFGLNSKAADSGSIGIFGLGMKSVFHFCEAFFWLAHDGDLQKEEILNPWSGNVDFPPPQSCWDNFSSEDADKIKRHLQDILSNLQKNSPFFLLWLPLRQKRQLNIEGEEVGSIISEFPGDDLKQVDFLFEAGLKRDLAEMLPFLRHLTLLRCWKAEGGSSLQLQYSVQLKKGAQRNTYPETRETSLLSGNVFYGGSKDDTEYTVKFVGHENRAKEEKLKELRKSKHWPESYVRDEMGRECRQRDKAKGHCAVTFSRSSEKTNGSLDIQWAVFLPVDAGRERCPCRSDYSYTLTLHGFFFVDAGRVAIEVFETDENEIVFPPQTENNLRAAWNYYLRKHTLLLLIPSLAKFAVQV
nr:hypothetical protein [Bacteroidales bacterium]